MRILTTAPVTLDHATVLHAGQGVDWAGTNTTGVNLTVTDSRFQATDPGGTFRQRAIELYEPGSLVVEHNDFVDGQGIWMRAGTPSVVRVRFNEVRNIGRYPHPMTAGCCVQFVQLTEGSSPGVEIAWNRVTNVYGQSNVEDVINMYQWSGTATGPIDIHHNLIDGSFPRTGNGASFTGSAAVLGDGGIGRFGQIHDNWVVNMANVGVSISGGQDNHMWGNRVVSDGKAGTVDVAATWSQGMNVWDGYGTGATARIDAHDNSVALLRPDGRADWWLPACDPVSACSGNVALPTPTAAGEQAERDAFAAAAAAAGVTIGAGTEPPPPPTTTTTTTSTTSPPTTTTTPPTTTTTPPAGVAFSATFDTANDFYGRFEGGHSGLDPVTFPPYVGAVREWDGDHNMSCGAPTTSRLVHIGDDNPDDFAGDKSELFWWCAPNGAETGHVMSSMNTSGYNIAWFAPVRWFADVARVCWDQNLTDLGGGQWVQVVVAGRADVERTDGDLGYVGPEFRDPNGPTTNVVPSDATVGVKLFRDQVSVWRGATFLGSSSGRAIVADKAARYRHCLADNSNGTITYSNVQPDGTTLTLTVGGAFPAGDARVAFQADTYDAGKHGDASTPGDPRYTWHWDNIEIR